jgi:hypothetical protein
LLYFLLESGGQPGHTGQTLAMVGMPDRIEPHRVERCKRCGRSLASTTAKDHTLYWTNYRLVKILLIL